MLSAWSGRWLSRRNIARFVLVIVTGLVIGLFYPQAGEDRGRVESVVISELATNKCSPAGRDCMAVGGGLAVSVRLPAMVPTSRAFRVTATVRKKSAEIESIDVAFHMKGMEMGVNRYLLKKKGDRWDALVVLPVCTAGRTDWRVQVSIRTGSRVYRAEFPFVTGSKSQ